MAYELLPHSNAEEWRRALVKRLKKCVNIDIKERGHAVLCLAGGGTPLPLYEALAKEDIEWSKVTVLPGDDRIVPHDDDASNFKQLREIFADFEGITVLPITSPDGDVEASLTVALKTLSDLWQPFSAVVLGLGNDMHTASLFPGAEALKDGIDMTNPSDALVVVPNPLPPEAPYPRISLTAARLLRAQKLILAIKGDAKKEALQEALQIEDPMQAPVMVILDNGTAQVEIHWSRS